MREEGAQLDWIQFVLLPDSSGGLDEDDTTNGTGTTTETATDSGSADDSATDNGSDSGTNSEPTAGTADGADTSNGDVAGGDSGGTTGGGTTGHSLLQEAEDGTLFGAMELGSDSNASGGKFVHVPANLTGNSNTDFVEFTVTILTTGRYQLNAGVRGPSGSQNSFFAQIDNGQTYLWDLPKDNKRTETLLNNRGTGVVTETLSTGVHTLRVSMREEGAQLDWIQFVHLDPRP
jgi:hypothetical protein